MNGSLSTAAAVPRPRTGPSGKLTTPPLGLPSLALPICIVVASCLPSALQFVASSVLITPSRVLCAAAFFLVLPSALSGNRYPRQLSDAFVTFFALWASICYVVNRGEDGIQSAGAIVLESFVPYFVGRFYVNGPDCLAKIAGVMMLIVWLLLPIAAIEAITRVHLVQDWLGVKSATEFGGESIRFGILRAMATFDHAIIYGVYCTSVLPLAWYILPRRMRLANIAAIAISVVLSASSAAFVGFALVAALIGWDVFTTRLQHRWRILGALFALGLVVIEIVSRRPLSSIVAGSLSFSSSTGWIRLIQWNVGWDNVAQNWLFGLGNRDWTRPAWLPASVDDYWLLNAMEFGVPGFLGIVGAVLSALVAVGHNKQLPADRKWHDARMGWMLAVILLAFVGLSVDYWKGMQVLFFLALGQGVFLGAARAREAFPAGERV